MRVVNPPPPLFLAFLCIMNSFDMIQELVKGLKRLLKRKTVHWLKKWKKSIINHKFWFVSSTNDDKPDLKEAKWLSITNHYELALWAGEPVVS